MEKIKMFGSKEIIFIDFNASTPINDWLYKFNRSDNHYAVLYAKKGSCITIDFIDYHTDHDSLFFLNVGQQLNVSSDSSGSILYFNPDFYCIAFHEKELSCSGLLFNNVFAAPLLATSSNNLMSLLNIIGNIKTEMVKEDTWVEEMLRTLLKQFIITASRIWLKENPSYKHEGTPEGEISRNFDMLVEKNYSRLHKVADYAALLNISPKTLNRRIVSEKRLSPHAVIKNRIMLQAKRLLAFTEMSVKEISLELGYEDHAYFVRFFKTQAGVPPTLFRTKAHETKNVVAYDAV